MDQNKPEPPKEPPKMSKKELKKLAKLQAEAELFKKLKTEELLREIRLQNVNKKKVDQKWREIMVKIKEPMFKKEIEVMWHVFERTYDKKDHLISYTMKLMDVADDQFQRTVASFCDTIDTMICRFLEDFEKLSQENDRRTAELLKKGENDAEKIMFDHDNAETHLQLMLYHGRITASNYAWTKRGENIVKEDEERSKFGSERDALRSFLENIYTTTWDQYKLVLKSYVTNVAENQKQVRILRRKENTMADIIASQAKKIANNDGLLKRLRNELQAYESGSKQAVFRDRRNRHRAACNRLKGALIDGNNGDAKTLDLLVQSSDEAKERLKQALKKAEKILRLSALCRRFETQKEKILPFGTQVPIEYITSKTGVKRELEDPMVVNAIAVNSGLTKLWQRVANAELSRRALLREKSLLEDEIKDIRCNFNKYKKMVADTNSKKCICTQPLQPQPKPVEKLDNVSETPTVSSTVSPTPEEVKDEETDNFTILGGPSYYVNL